MENRTEKAASLRRTQQVHGSIESVEMEHERVENLAYFYSELSRIQAQDVMSRHADKPGSFLLRLGSKHRRYAITIVLDRNVIGHIEIFSPTDKCFYAEKEFKFKSISELVQHYECNPIPNNSDHRVTVFLKHPIRKFRPRQPFPYQEVPLIYETNSRTKPSYDRATNGALPFLQQAASFHDENNQLVELRLPPQPPCGDRQMSAVHDETIPKEIFNENSTENCQNPRFLTRRGSYIDPETIPSPSSVKNIKRNKRLFSSQYSTAPKTIYSSQSQTANEARTYLGSDQDNVGYLLPISATKGHN